MRKISIVLLLILILAIGCSKKYTKPPEEAVKPEKPAVEEVVKPAEKVVEEEIVEEVEVPEIKEEKIEEVALPVEERAKSVFKDVLFDFDKYDIRPDARPILDNIAAFLKEEKDVNIIIEGHCDERGTNEYNLALGEKRARAVRDYLASLGVVPTRTIIVTYGEEKPLCTEQNEACWQRNRRAHFVIAR
jgi:peptidoglycan-associated lipoprotein